MMQECSAFTFNCCRWRCSCKLLYNPFIFWLWKSLLGLALPGSPFPVEFKGGYDQRSNLHSLCTQWGMYDTILSITSWPSERFKNSSFDGTHCTVTLSECNGTSFISIGFSFAQNRMFCLLTYPLKLKCASSDIINPPRKSGSSSFWRSHSQNWTLRSKSPGCSFWQIWILYGCKNNFFYHSASRPIAGSQLLG